jgi:hypothetical protein
LTGAEALDARFPDVQAPLHDRDILVPPSGRICMHRMNMNISTVLASQRVGIEQGGDAIWLGAFMKYDPGHLDLEQRTLQPLDNPTGTRVLPIS